MSTAGPGLQRGGEGEGEGAVGGLGPESAGGDPPSSGARRRGRGDGWCDVIYPSFWDIADRGLSWAPSPGAERTGPGAGSTLVNGSVPRIVE